MKKIDKKEIKDAITLLETAGFEAYLVGGCVRDLLLNKEPKDWDIATNALPEEIQKIFPDSVYENQFGTVAVKTESADPTLKIIEITTYREEGKYTDKRHPDEVRFSKAIEDDLSRRDFTINSIAIKIDGAIVDPFAGQEDLKNKIIKTVGDPGERFNEDALRLMRAIRLAAELDFGIEKKTADAIKRHANLMEMIAKERIRDEFIKLIMSDRAGDGVRMMAESGLLKYVIPELMEGVGVGQNKHHIFTVFDHNVRALEYAVKSNYSLEVRLASLLHDVGKPQTKRGDGPDSTFYAHDIVGAKMTLRILDRLHFPKKTVEQVAHLVRCHLFYYNVGEVSAAGVRRFLRKVGPEHIDDLIKVREADRIGSGVPKAVPYKLRHLLFMIEKVKQDPIDTRMLKMNGDDVMRLGNLQPGHKVGYILAILLEEILDDPQKNSEDHLKKRIRELNELPDQELKKMSEKARERKEEFEGEAEEEIKKKFYIK
ncbi:MAG: HD domain-containing protein [Patescibacteria group bacterium]